MLSALELSNVFPGMPRDRLNTRESHLYCYTVCTDIALMQNHGNISAPELLTEKPTQKY